MATTPDVCSQVLPVLMAGAAAKMDLALAATWFILSAVLTAPGGEKSWGTVWYNPRHLTGYLRSKKYVRIHGQITGIKLRIIC